MAKMTYSPAEICEMFGIVKTTLFRWETEGKLSPVLRKINNEREYTKTHVQEIARIQIENLAQQYERAAELENQEQMKQIHETLTLYKVLYLEDLTGLFELTQQNSLSDEIIEQLLQKASETNIHDRLFQQIIEVLHHYVNQTNPQPV
jgi:DNA-binding transcriptional MerR regulator